MSAAVQILSFVGWPNREGVNHSIGDALVAGDPDAAADKTRDFLDAVQRFARTR
jgi:hypothetical protein